MQPPMIPDFFRLFERDEVDSTSDEVKRLASAGADEGTLVWAHRQTQGRGRHRRVWVSAPGNLFFSLLLKPHRPAQEAMQVSFVAALAMVEAIARDVGPDHRVRCKWPNDVLIEGRKVCGILLESATDPAGTIEHLIVGVGVNIASHPPESDVMYPATSLHAEGALEETPRALLERFCRTFDAWYRGWLTDGFAVVRDAWLARAHGLGEPVEVRLEGEAVTGVFAGIDAGGALLVQQGDRQRVILAGDVFAADQ